MQVNEIPISFWRELCNDADYPMACVGVDNKFIWVNYAFERLVGYSTTELAGLSWTSITKQQNVGGDLASVQSVIEGKINEYSLSKDYIHKRGHLVSVELIVRRFPPSQVEPILCFMVESPMSKPTKTDLQKIQDEFAFNINELREKIQHYESGVRIFNNNENQMGDKWRDGDKTIGNKTINSDSAIKLMAVAFLGMVITVAWLFYYVATNNNNVNPVPPPNIPVIGE